MLSLLFVGFVAIMLLQLDDPKLIAAFGGATGVSLAWIVNRFRGAWRDKWFVDLVAISMDRVSPAAFDELVLLLINYLARDGADLPRRDIAPATPAPATTAAPATGNPAPGDGGGRQ